MTDLEDRKQELPFVTPDLGGIGGELKTSVEHFVVEEVPLYLPNGIGEHVYLTVRREGWTTRDLAGRLGRIGGLPERDVGYAGLKDKHARATQTFSLALRGDEQAFARVVAEELGVEVLACARHGNKLRRGHLLGNRFQVVLARPATADVANALARANEIAARLAAVGMPNFYGVQRLGGDGEHARRGERDLAAPKRTFASRFALNAFQAELFNRVVAERLRRGWFDRVLLGDVAKKVANGALFDVLDEEAERERALRREIVATGPMYGGTMRWPTGEPGTMEREVLAASGKTIDAFSAARLDGTRRATRVFVDDIAIEPGDEGLRFTFQLPKGSYATTLLREFTKDVVALDESDEE